MRRWRGECSGCFAAKALVIHPEQGVPLPETNRFVQDPIDVGLVKHSTPTLHYAAFVPDVFIRQAITGRWFLHGRFQHPEGTSKQAACQGGRMTESLVSRTQTVGSVTAKGLPLALFLRTEEKIYTEDG